MKHENTDVEKRDTTGENMSTVHRIVQRKCPKIMSVFILVQISFYI